MKWWYLVVFDEKSILDLIIFLIELASELVNRLDSHTEFITVNALTIIVKNDWNPICNSENALYEPLRDEKRKTRCFLMILYQKRLISMGLV